MPSNSAPLPRIEAETMRRITWRLLPFFMLCYFISYVDRVNAGFAFPMALIPLALLQIAGIIAVLWISKQETLPATSAASPVH